MKKGEFKKQLESYSPSDLQILVADLFQFLQDHVKIKLAGRLLDIAESAIEEVLGVLEL